MAKNADFELKFKRNLTQNWQDVEIEDIQYHTDHLEDHLSHSSQLLDLQNTTRQQYIRFVPRRRNSQFFLEFRKFLDRILSLGRKS